MQFTSIYWQWWTWSSWRPLRSAIQVYTSQKVLFPSKSLLQSAVTKSEQVYAVQVYVCASVCVCVCVCVHVYVSMCMYAFSCTAEMKCDTKWKPWFNRCWLKVVRFGRRLDPWQNWNTGSSVQPNSPAWWTRSRHSPKEECSQLWLQQIPKSSRWGGGIGSDVLTNVQYSCFRHPPLRSGVSLMDVSRMLPMRQRITWSTCTPWSDSASPSTTVTLWACWRPSPASHPPYRWYMLSTTPLREWPHCLSRWDCSALFNGQCILFNGHCIFLLAGRAWSTQLGGPKFADFGLLIWVWE